MHFTTIAIRVCITYDRFAIPLKQRLMLIVLVRYNNLDAEDVDSFYTGQVCIPNEEYLGPLMHL